MGWFKKIKNKKKELSRIGQQSTVGHVVSFACPHLPTSGGPCHNNKKTPNWIKVWTFGSQYYLCPHSIPQIKQRSCVPTFMISFHLTSNANDKSPSIFCNHPHPNSFESHLKQFPCFLNYIDNYLQKKKKKKKKPEQDDNHFVIAWKKLY